jgi:hypothetical protein
MELPAVVERFATDFDALPMLEPERAAALCSDEGDWPGRAPGRRVG